MTAHRSTILGALLLGACAAGPQPAPEAGAAGLTSREQETKQYVDEIPIQAVITSAEARADMRRAGLPVMHVRGEPAPIYRDYQHPEGEMRLRIQVPQEVPDVHGCVIVSYDVRRDGKTDGFEIESSTPPTVFDRAALRAMLATEYEPATGPRPRQQRALWFLIARPPRAEASPVNEAVEASRNRRREEQRAECQARAP